MSFPPPHSGQYPQYIPPPQYQPGHVDPPQLLYNNVAPPSASPYNGYAKQPVYPYPQGITPYPSYPQYNQQPQQPQQPHLIHHQQQQPPQPRPPPIPQHQQQPQPQLQPQLQPQSPHLQFQQHSPRPRFQQQSPRLQFQQQSPRAHVQPQSPRLSLQHQSPRQQPQQRSPYQPQQQLPASPAQVQPPRPPAQPAPPPPLPQEEQQHQFINPSQLFVQPPLPSAPRSRYSQSSDYVDPSAMSTSVLTNVSPVPSNASSAPSQPLPAPPLAPGNHVPPPNSFQHTQDHEAQPSLQTQPSRPIKAEPAKGQPSPKVEMKPPSTSKAPSKFSRPQPTPSPGANAVPQAMIPAPSPEYRTHMQKQSQKKPLQKRQPSQQSIEKPAKPNKTPVDYQVLLLSLADEYLNSAHRHGTKMALTNRAADVEEYYKLIATGLGCLEAVLKNWRLQPRKEALVRLRYARTLFEETDNDIEAETALSKGIDLCDRNRMLDLKYSMQHLLARMLHKTNPKASLKAVDGMIQNVEAYRHAAWEYAFRFLRVSLSLSCPSQQDSVQALQHLHKIAAMAGRNGDKAVSAIAAAIEALAHLQQGVGSDAIEQAQRAVAVARSHQLNDELRHIPQVVALVQMADICCSLLEYDVNQSGQKLKVLQALVDETLNDANWRCDGSFSIPLNGKSAGPSSIDTGDILQVQNGTLLLSFNWLPQHDLYALSYFLSSVTLSAKNSHDGRKAEKYLDEGLRMIQGGFKAPQEIAESMVNASRRVEWRRYLYCNFLLQRVFLAAARTDWDLASQSLKELRQSTQEFGTNHPESIECLMTYAAGTIAQGTGDLATALSTFQSPVLLLSSSASKTSRNDPCRDTRILAALNTVLIIRDPGHPSHSSLANILATLESFCHSSPNKYIQAAYFLVCATVQTNSTLQTKQYLQQALQSAMAISNSQITCITLTFMSWKYFRGVVGEQAEKSARAGRTMARKANDRLWGSVTDEMLAETLERQGKSDEARSVREQGQRLFMGLPPGLKRPA